MKFVRRHFAPVSLSVFTTLGVAEVATAADGADKARGFVSAINDAILYPLISLMIGVALIVFMYGAFEFVRGADNDSEREKGKQHLLWGTVGLLVMVSAMAILSIAANTFNLDGELYEAAPDGARLR